jgi:hypothetical protein
MMLTGSLAAAKRRADRSAPSGRATPLLAAKGIVSKFNFVQLRYYTTTCTDKKDYKIFLIKKEIQKGAFAKSYIQ